ncbi:MAG: hypothetical protein H6Q75_1635 [Firmicutes bacterium]|nr:hypothetical protein [Bacillota bacterium]
MNKRSESTGIFIFIHHSVGSGATIAAAKNTGRILGLKRKKDIEVLPSRS